MWVENLLLDAQAVEAGKRLWDMMYSGLSYDQLNEQHGCDPNDWEQHDKRNATANLSAESLVRLGNERKIISPQEMVTDESELHS